MGENESPSSLSWHQELGHWETIFCVCEGMQAIKGEGTMGHYLIVFISPEALWGSCRFLIQNIHL